MRRQRSGHINHRHFQRCRNLRRTGRRASNLQIGSIDVRIDQHRQIRRIDGTLEMRLVQLRQIVITLFRIAAKMMPHQIVDDSLRHAFGAQIASIKALVAPLDPAGRR